MSEKGQAFDLDGFLSRQGYSLEDLEAASLEVDVLKNIYTKHQGERDQLEIAGDCVSTRLRKLRGVHSLKLRVKSPERLLAKIVKKKLADPTLEITPDTYDGIITDLVGVRALHLYKNDWKLIHEFVMATWDRQEPPKANYRGGDHPELLKSLKEAGCELKENSHGYRSIHYLLKVKPERKQQIVELQVRTLFEEGWSEIDHALRYSNSPVDQWLEQSLRVFNMVAGNADDMGTLIMQLVDDRKAVLEEHNKGIKEAVFDMKKASTAEKEKLVEKLTTGSLSLSQELSLDEILGVSPTMVTFPDASLPRQDGYVLYSGPRKICSKCGKQYEEGIPKTIMVGNSRLDLVNLCPDCRNQALTESSKAEVD